MIIDIWGGELVRDNFNIKINESKGLNRGVVIKYGKNIIGINQIVDSDNVVTKIYPVGEDNLMLPEKYLTSTFWMLPTYPDFYLTKKIEFPEISTESILRSTAEAYLLANIYPNVNYKIDFMKLSKTSDYKDYKVLEKVEVGDTVKVIHTLLNIDIDVKVIGIEKDILSDKNTKVELGQPLSTFANFLPKICVG
jgi:phage minor structural protein